MFHPLNSLIQVNKKYLLLLRFFEILLFRFEQNKTNYKSRIVSCWNIVPGNDVAFSFYFTDKRVHRDIRWNEYYCFVFIQCVQITLNYIFFSLSKKFHLLYKILSLIFGLSWHGYVSKKKETKIVIYLGIFKNLKIYRSKPIQ